MCRSNWILMTYHPVPPFLLRSIFFPRCLGCAIRKNELSLARSLFRRLCCCNVQNTSGFLIEIQWMPPNSTLMTQTLHFMQSKDISVSLSLYFLAFFFSRHTFPQQTLYFYRYWKYAYAEHCFCHQLKIPLHSFCKRTNNNHFYSLGCELPRCSKMFICSSFLFLLSLQKKKWTECLFEIINNHFWQMVLTTWINIKIAWNRVKTNIICGGNVFK